MALVLVLRVREEYDQDTCAVVVLNPVLAAVVRAVLRSAATSFRMPSTAPSKTVFSSEELTSFENLPEQGARAAVEKQAGGAVGC